MRCRVRLIVPNCCAWPTRCTGNSIPEPHHLRDDAAGRCIKHSQLNQYNRLILNIILLSEALPTIIVDAQKQ
jgi:hypothetical protein